MNTCKHPFCHDGTVYIWEPGRSDTGGNIMVQSAYRCPVCQERTPRVMSDAGRKAVRGKRVEGMPSLAEATNRKDSMQ